MKCTFVIYRFDPAVDKEPRYQEYTVEAEPTDKILDCLNKIRWDQDPTLSYRYSCAHGICGSDALMINGRIELACQKLVRDFKTANNFVIEPLPHREVRPYLISDQEPPETERLQDAANQGSFEPALRCILCGSCTASCPISRTNQNYLGPAALLRAFRYVADSRDTATESRLAQLDNEDGAWGCKTMWWCTDVCPKGIPITKSIGQIKRLIKEGEKKNL